MTEDILTLSRRILNPREPPLHEYEGQRLAQAVIDLTAKLHELNHVWAETCSRAEAAERAVIDLTAALNLQQRHEQATNRVLELRQRAEAAERARAEQHMIACDLTSDVMSLRKRLDAAECARDEAHTDRAATNANYRLALQAIVTLTHERDEAQAAIKQALDALLAGGQYAKAIKILSDANTGLQPGSTPRTRRGRP